MTPTLPLLTRAQAARVRELFQEKQVRARERAFVVEGRKAVCDLLAHRADLVQCLVVTPGYLKRESGAERRQRQALAVPQHTCTDTAFSRLSSLDSPQGILAVMGQPRWNEGEILGRANLFGLYGEHLQDPTNVGAIIRTAAALNVTALWLTPDSADIYNPKVVRSTSGALLTLPIFTIKDLSGFLHAGCDLYAAVVPDGKAVPLSTIREAPRKLVLAFGNESQGLSSATINAATSRFTIPLNRRVDSLNVAATVAISTFYFQTLRTHPA